VHSIGAMIQSFEAVTADLILDAASHEGLALAPVPQPSQRFTTAGMPAAPLASVHALWEAAVRGLADPLFPLRCGKRPTEHARSIVVMAGMVSPTLGEAVHRVVRYWPLVTDAFRWTVTEEGERVSMATEMPGDASLGWRCGMEFHVVDIIHTAQVLTGGAFAPRELRLSHEPPRTVIRALEDLVRARVRTGTGRVEIVAERAQMDLPLALQVPAPLERFVLSLAERALAEVARPPSFVERVKRMMEEGPPDARTTLERVAGQMGVSTRTLHRRLEEHGCSFQGLLDEVRRRRAQLLLTDDGLSSEQIADALGLSRRGFFRAFRRWTGVTPAAYRGDLG
jgi:AraC-like DNA-binding protein